MKTIIKIKSLKVTISGPKPDTNISIDKMIETLHVAAQSVNEQPPEGLTEEGKAAWAKTSNQRSAL